MSSFQKVTFCYIVLLLCGTLTSIQRIVEYLENGSVHQTWNSEPTRICQIHDFTIYYAQTKT